MSLSQVFDIFQKPSYDETIQKFETRSYHPYVKSFNNNDVIEITINQADSWILMHEAALIIEGKIVGADSANISLVNNAGAFLFDSISYDLMGHEVETVRDPGILSTIKGYLCYSPYDSNHLDIAGWSYPNNPKTYGDDKVFTLRIPLKHLLGIFTDYSFAMFGKQTIRLVRARTDNDAIIKSEVTDQGQITIENISLKASIVTPNDVLKLRLLEFLKKDTPIVIPFRKWEYHELPQLTVGATKETWAVKTCTSVESPRYVIIAFQENKRGNATANSTHFDNINATDIRVMLNGNYYPSERMSIDFEKGNYNETHYNYSQFYPSFRGDCSIFKQTLLNYTDFQTRALFVIDCSLRIDALKSSTVDVKIDIETKNGFSVNTKGYCIIVHDAVIEQLPLSEIVRKLT